MDRSALSRVPLEGDPARAALAQLPEWAAWLHALHTAYWAPTAAVAIELIGRIGALAEELDHHPDVDWRHRLVFVSTTTHSAGHRVTAFDLELARRVSRVAAELGAAVRLDLAQSVEIGIDTGDVDAVRGVWRAALGYRDLDEGLADPHRRGPRIWFQETPTPAASRLHLDVSVDVAAAEPRARAAVAAGAVREDTWAPSWVVLTDPAGDRVCVCTSEGRSDPTS